MNINRFRDFTRKTDLLKLYFLDDWFSLHIGRLYMIELDASAFVVCEERNRITKKEIKKNNCITFYDNIEVIQRNKKVLKGTY